MAYRGAVIEQKWTKEEMDAYWAERIEGKRPAHVKKVEQDDALRFSKNIERKGNVLSLTRPNKQQYERCVKQGLTEQDIISRYPQLPAGWLQEAKKRWGLA